MATKKPKGVVRMTPDPEQPETWQPEPGRETVIDDEDLELDEVFSEFPQNETCIQLFRINAQGGRPLFLEQVTPGMFSFAYVAEKHGGGRYQAKGKYKDGSKVRMPFEIEGDPFPMKRRMETPISPIVPTAAPTMADPLPDLSGQNFQAALLTMMRQLLSESRQSETQMLEKMRLYKELFGTPAKETPLDTAISMFTKGVELAASQGSGGDGPNFWMLALKELKEPLAKIVDTVQFAVTQSARKPVTATVTPPPPGQPVEAIPTPGPQPVEEPMIAFLRSVLPSLVNGASRNADPQFYADFLLDQVPQSFYNAALIWLKTPDCLDKLAAVEPGIRFQYEWWISLRDTLIRTLTEELLGDTPVQPDTLEHLATRRSTPGSDLS